MGLLPGSFLCVAKGTSTPTITWLINVEELDADSRYMMISRNGTGILIENATGFDQGQYPCMASNTVLTITAITTLFQQLKVYLCFKCGGVSI